MKDTVTTFKKKTEKALESIGKPDDFQKRDKHIQYIFEIGEWLFSNDLDKTSESSLIRVGGRLTGVYSYLGNRAAYARAERDVYEQKRDEVMGNLVLEKLDNQYKVTEARALAKQEVSELEDWVVEKELEKNNNYENLMAACDKMISFVQTAISYKKAERFRGQMHDQQ